MSARCHVRLHRHTLGVSSFTPALNLRVPIPSAAAEPISDVSLPTRIDPTCVLGTLPSFSIGIAVLGFIVFVHEAGHFLAARVQGIKVDNFSLGFGSPLVEWKSKDGITFSLRALPLGGYVAFPEKTKVNEETGEEEESDDPDLLQNRPLLDRAIVISAGVIANIILAWTSLFISVGTVGVPKYDFKPGVTLQTLVDSNGPGANAGLRGGDVILKVDGEEVQSTLGSAGAVADLIRTSNGRELSFTVSRNDGTTVIKVRPSCAANGNCAMGVQLVPNVSVARERPPTFPLLIRTTNDEMARLTSQTLSGLLSIVTNFKQTASQLSGPIGVVSIGADIARNDASALLTFVAIISINLAILNSVPIPALDGGQMVFLLIEGLRGAPVPLKLQNALNTTAFLMFFGLSGVLLIQDVTRGLLLVTKSF